MTGLGSALNDALYTRVTGLLTGIDLYYKGEQGESAEYVLFLDDDERYSPEGSDKNGRANDYVAVLQFWGERPRTLATRAKTVLDSLYTTPLVVSGFYHIRTTLEQNQQQPAFSTEGQPNQHSRVMRVRFLYHPE